MTAKFYLTVMLIVCFGTPIASIVYHSVRVCQKLVRNIRQAEINIIEILEEKLPGDLLDSVVDVVTEQIEEALKKSREE